MPVPLVPVVEPLAELDSPLSPEDVPPDDDSGGRSTTSIISTYSRSIFGRKTVLIGLENQATRPGVPLLFESFVIYAWLSGRLQFFTTLKVKVYWAVLGV